MKIIRFKRATAVLTQDQFEFYEKVKEVYEKRETSSLWVREIRENFSNMLPREFQYKLGVLREQGALKRPKNGFLTLNIEL